MSKTQKSHLWIPDEEVQQIDKELTARPKSRLVQFAKHGRKLSQGLQSIKEAMESASADNSLIDSNMLVFSVELPEGEKIQYKKDLFTSTGMNIRAVKTSRHAIVTSTKSQFQTLKERVDKYTRRGTGKTYFDNFETFKPYIGAEKNSNGLKKVVSSEKIPAELDVQFMLIPNMDADVYETAIKKLSEKIKKTQGSIQQTPYYLSDGTPVIRAIILSSTLSRYENDPAIYRIEETEFFSVDTNGGTSTDLRKIELPPDIKLDELPIVTVLDSGVLFPTNLSSLIIAHWLGNKKEKVGGDGGHGTKVASRVAFKYIEQQLPSPIIIPRARIVDCNILDGPVPVNIFIQRIQNAVNQFADISKIYNLSANTSAPIEGDEISIVGYELDALQLRKNVQFVLSAGNHELWKTETSLEDILDDDDSRISAPADSMLSVVVGSVVGENHKGSISRKNEIAPYSRRGPGFHGLPKPDLTAYAGTITKENGIASVPRDVFSSLLTKDGTLVPDAGTSFSAPIVAGDLAEILSITPGNNTLLAKALLYHYAIPLWDEDDIENSELAFAHCLYGRGISNVEDSKFSSPSRVTFVRTGSLNRKTKERVTIYMPPILAAQKGRNIAKVTVTCMSMPPVDRTSGTEYVGAYIRASLKKKHEDGTSLMPVPHEIRTGREKWDVCCHFSKLFSKLNAGDWQVWLELFSRWDDDKDVDVPYALAVTIEDVSETLDVYSEVEVLNRYRPINKIRLRFDNP